MGNKHWDGKERRRADNDEGRWEFERDVIMFMARIDERLDNRDDTCDARGETVKKLGDRVTSLETFRNIVVWTFKLLGYGSATVATAYGAVVGIMHLRAIIKP
jgi:hypothetical protein